jgi:hypothetical protein
MLSEMPEPVWGPGSDRNLEMVANGRDDNAHMSN